MRKTRAALHIFLVKTFILLSTLGLGFSAAQSDLPALEVELFIGWDATNAAPVDYPPLDVVPVSAQVNRNSYVYLFVVGVDGSVTLNYPSPFIDGARDNVIWGNQGQSFLRFVDTGVQEGILEVYFIASLEPFTQGDIAQFTSAEAFTTAALSTPWSLIYRGQAEVSNAATLSQAFKEASPLWSFYQYILNQGG